MRSRGFTLIELLVVFALIALLLTLAVPRYATTYEAAKEKVRAQNLSTLRDAIDKFRADQGRYPSELTELIAKNYLRGLPVDPITGSTSWEIISAPTATEPGVYDVGPPDMKPATSEK